MANVMFWLARLTAILVAVNITALAISVSLVNLPYAKEPGGQIAQVQRSQQSKAGKVAAETPMRRCMATWDRETQMSKREWRETCERTIREYPGLYSKPF
jgi:hypothetical protein